jgi:hypothetical protein
MDASSIICRRDLLSVREVANALSLGPSTVHKYSTNGLRLPNGELLVLESFILNGRRRFTSGALVDFVQKQLDLQHNAKSKTEVQGNPSAGSSEQPM